MELIKLYLVFLFYVCDSQFTLILIRITIYLEVACPAILIEIVVDDGYESQGEGLEFLNWSKMLFEGVFGM